MNWTTTLAAILHRVNADPFGRYPPGVVQCRGFTADYVNDRLVGPVEIHVGLAPAEVRIGLVVGSVGVTKTPADVYGASSFPPAGPECVYRWIGPEWATDVEADEPEIR